MKTRGATAVPFVVNDMSILAAKPGGAPPANEAVGTAVCNEKMTMKDEVKVPQMQWVMLVMDLSIV